jgi:murein L,D-transpeptidase YcbB/YkuD
MENPWVLADFLIRDDKRYSTDSLFTYYVMEQRKTIPLRKALPICIRYFTSGVDSKNKLYFYYDIYGKDKKMSELLYSGVK